MARSFLCNNTRLRHTAITQDVSTRPMSDVRDDAGHQSIQTTNIYLGQTGRLAMNLLNLKVEAKDSGGCE